MTEQPFPITPSQELVQGWLDDWYDLPAPRPWFSEWMTSNAALWAADQELKACCEWLKESKNHGFGYEHGKSLADKYHATRRPKSSLAQRVLHVLGNYGNLSPAEHDAIQRVLKQLPELT